MDYRAVKIWAVKEGQKLSNSAAQQHYEGKINW